MPNYTGIWGRGAQMQATAAGTWTGQPYLYTWGRNNNGHLGLGNTTNYSSPKQVGSLTWLTVSAASVSSFAIKTDGTLWSWGQNASGQLGLGNLTYYSSPKQIGSATNWVSINCGAGSSYGMI